MSKRFFGAHVSTAGGIASAIANAERFGINTVQIHPSPPQRWNTQALAPKAAEEFRDRRIGTGLEKLFFHAIYLINLANPDPEAALRSRTSLVHYLELLDAVGGDGVIFHVGSLKDGVEADGFRQAADGINRIMEKARGTGRLLMEVSAGAGTIIGDRFEELAAIYEMVECKERVGFALDSQHMWASGYDLRGKLDEVVSEAVSVFGLDKIWAIHLNDSKTELGSRRDRHENFGQGLIGREAMTNFLNHPTFTHIPYILETPALKTPETTMEEIETVRKVIHDEA